MPWPDGRYIQASIFFSRWLLAPFLLGLLLCLVLLLYRFFADLFGLVALVSQRRQCVMIGEDLGTVPEGFRERMDAMGILGYRLMVFEKKDGGVFKGAAEMQPQALVSFGTHDLPSLHGWWKGIDIESRDRLSIYPDPAMAAQEWRSAFGS